VIVYTMVSNHGGMLRVAESALAIHAQLKLVTEMRIFIFSERPPEGDIHPDIEWIEWNENENPYTKEKIEYYREIIKTKIPDHVDFLIGDYMTLAYFDFVKAEIIYDVHVLGKPLYQAIKTTPGIHALDHVTTAPVATLIDAQEFLFLKFENKFITKAKRFIVNSLNSERFLKDLYTEEVKGKPMAYIPVASELKIPDKKFSKNIDVYYFGRFHPVKGFHFMFSKDWKNHPLFIRGLEPRVLNNESREMLKSRSITAHAWAQNSQSLVEELLSSRLVLFPSIYEPWGLALQEALSLGCVCLANRNQSGHEEQIEEGVNGFLVDMNSPDWFQRISEILAMPEEKLALISHEAKQRSTLGLATRTQGFVDYIKLLLEKKV